MAADLATIQTKVRRLTRSPSSAEITNAQINEYINTFVLYDFPEHLRLFDFHTTFKFVCNPNQDVYLTTNNSNVLSATNPLFNFKNNYITVNPPVYIDGYQVFYSQSQSDFLAQYPQIDFIEDLGAGNGTPGPYSFQLTNKPIAQNTVMLSGINISNQSATLQDYPITSDGQFGVLRAPNDALDRGIVDYINGTIINATFNAAIIAPDKINAHYYAYTAGRPLSLYYFTQQKRYTGLGVPDVEIINEPMFVLRPIPDQAYTIEFQAYKRPTELMNGDEPELEQYWQYIAYGAAKKIFEDRMDLDSVQMILPEFTKQEQLVLRRTIVQQTNQRTSTIYTQQTNMTATWPGWGWNQF